MKRRTFPRLADKYIQARMICPEYQSQIRRVAKVCIRARHFPYT